MRPEKKGEKKNAMQNVICCRVDDKREMNDGNARTKIADINSKNVDGSGISFVRCTFSWIFVFGFVADESVKIISNQEIIIIIYPSWAGDGVEPALPNSILNRARSISCTAGRLKCAQ